MIKLLSDSDAWIQMGLEYEVLQGELSAFFEKLESDEVRNLIPTNDTLTDFVLWNGKRPIAWGNYYFGTEGFLSFTDGVDDRLVYCDRYQGYDSKTSIPYEYLFVVVDISSGNIKTTYLSDQTEEPTWSINGGSPLKPNRCTE